jgi:hypothetical protein
MTSILLLMTAATDKPADQIGIYFDHPWIILMALFLGYATGVFNTVRFFISQSEGRK